MTEATVFDGIDVRNGKLARLKGLPDDSIMLHPQRIDNTEMLDIAIKLADARSDADQI